MVLPVVSCGVLEPQHLPISSIQPIFSTSRSGDVRLATGIASAADVPVRGDAAYGYKIAHDHRDGTAGVCWCLVCTEGLGSDDVACRPSYEVESE